MQPGGRGASRKWPSTSRSTTGSPPSSPVVPWLPSARNSGRSCFLTYWEDLTPSQIADLLDVGEGSVRKQLARARETLRSVLS